VCALHGEKDRLPPRGLCPVEVDEVFAVDGLGDCVSGYNISELKSGEVNHAPKDDMLFNIFVIAQ
jgi:hypothetical protein